MISNMWKTKRNTCSTTSPWFFICALLPLMAQNVCLSQGAADTLSPGQSISETQTLVSIDSVFELGFFKTGRSTSRKMYLGIWYKDFEERTFVWVANRDKPVIDSCAGLKISEDGNLVLLINESDTLWSTNLDSLASDSVEAVLLNSGNFVLRDALKPSTIFWQSFDHPTDTWLPGAKFGMDKLNRRTQMLTSWKNSEDPSPSLYSFRIDNEENNQYVIEWNMSRRYWSSGLWDRKTFSLVPELSYLYEFKFISNEHEAYFTYSVLNNQIMSRLVMNISGQLQQLSCMRGDRNWSLNLDQPRDQSDVYAICGAFGIMNKTSSAPCQCLQGFEESSANHCARKTSLQCENSNSSNGKRDGFLKIPNGKLPADSNADQDQKSKKSCELECFRKCSCTAYAYNDEGCSSWEGSLFGVQLSDKDDNNAHDLYLKLAASDIPKDGGNKMILWVVIPVVVSAAVLVSGGFICIFCIRKKLKQRGEKNSGKDLLSYDFNGNSSANDDETDIGNLRRGANKDVDLPFFSFASVSEATSNFSAENKLGEGGFGPVYKGKSLNGQEIALKRLSKRSGQGLEEFRNEIVLIAKLQHRNLVRLLGCSIEREESILIYEYMSNKSLDFFIFDPNNKELLDWETRIRIIEGIAQGLLYLHHYSRLRIIHRDLKASNILLDSEMNPKISDFGMARIFDGNESQANTKRIVGTYGYMAPEYAMGGHFSIKSDVFSFGVLLLEIVSGKKNTGFYHSESLNLLGHAWDLWISDKASELKDPSVAYPSSTSRVLRYINVGLLCVQENLTDRPTMSHVVSMLSNDVVALPTPKQPAFVASQGMNKNVSTNCGNFFSVNGLTVSSIEPR